MAKINIAWINDEVIADLVYEAEVLTGYIADAEEEIDALCLTQGQTITANIPLDDDGYYLSPSLRILSKYMVKKFIYDGYEGSSDGDTDIYVEKDNEELAKKIEKWEGRVTPASIQMTVEVAQTSSSYLRSIPCGG